MRPWFRSPNTSFTVMPIKSFQTFLLYSHIILHLVKTWPHGYAFSSSAVIQSFRITEYRFTIFFRQPLLFKRMSRDLNGLTILAHSTKWSFSLALLSLQSLIVITRTLHLIFAPILRQSCQGILLSTFLSPRLFIFRLSVPTIRLHQDISGTCLCLISWWSWCTLICINCFLFLKVYLLVIALPHSIRLSSTQQEVYLPILKQQTEYFLC